MSKTYGGLTIKQLRSARQASVKIRGIGLKDEFHAHGHYLSFRSDITANVQHLDEIAQGRGGGPFQALPINREEDVLALATAYNALPELLAEVERLTAALVDCRTLYERALEGVFPPGSPRKRRCKQWILGYRQC